jgi:hypothetical protein
VLRCSEADVWAVLDDGWLFGLWVVGASRIREVDPSWPQPGTKVHHSVGVWPALVDDSTSVLERETGRMKLRARAWPAGEAEVIIETQPVGDGTRVTVTEDAARGPALLIPKPVRTAMLQWRNTESLRRLSYLAENRQALSHGLSNQLAGPPSDDP